MSDIGNKEIFSKNLKHYIERSGKDRSTICDDLDMKYSTFSEWVSGKKYPRIDNIEKLADYFGIKKSDLIEKPVGEVYNPIVHEIHILGYISAGLPIYADEHIIGKTYTELNGGAEYFALKVKGDSMNAVPITEGSTVIVRVQPEVENGEIAVVRVNGEDATIKRFKHDGNMAFLIPQSYNPIHQVQTYNLSDTDIQVIGKVIKCEIDF